MAIVFLQQNRSHLSSGALFSLAAMRFVLCLDFGRFSKTQFIFNPCLRQEGEGVKWMNDNESNKTHQSSQRPTEQNYHRPSEITKMLLLAKLPIPSLSLIHHSLLCALSKTYAAGKFCFCFWNITRYRRVFLFVKDRKTCTNRCTRPTMTMTLTMMMMAAGMMTIVSFGWRENRFVEKQRNILLISPYDNYDPQITIYIITLWLAGG